MKTSTLTFLLAAFLINLISCSTNDDEPTVTTPSDSVTYLVTYNGQWTGSSHPIEYPDNSHFSGVIGMSHNKDTSLFENGSFASEGIKVMAETGGKDPLTDEINAIIDNNLANHLISEGGLSTGSSSIQFTITLVKDYPLVSLVSMIAPSPDWYVAIEGVNLLKSNDEWIEKLEVTPIHYDAGTDSGVTFKSPNSPTIPAKVISVITEAPLGNGTEVTPPLTTFTFEKQ
ncbi:elongation factor Ts [Flammeovirga pectinis]|uniref:Elongation factor Ts n=1 Tax=Flammeovirga pectinis TaxID=2494373 RepID=A0A3S9P8C3_9BACT|nr:spondin domain-containing protein [Flammeovirga pectinis]AZQ64404.1 elongation factor Ts [Flammeovirga pectinis]